MSVTTRNPLDGTALATFEHHSASEVLARLEGAHSAHVAWAEAPIEERAAALRSLGSVLRERSEGLARLMTLEMGKPISAARAEVEKCAWTCEQYADRAAVWLAEEEVVADGDKHRVIYQPLGVILAVMPWNFPFWQVVRFLAPTLLVGNGALLKHASNVTGSSLAIQEAVEAAGFPEGLFASIVATHESVAEVIAHPLCQGVSLTGSTAAGKRLTEQAGRHMKKVVMELGGSDPFIVLDDADIVAAAQAAVVGRFQNNGQSCIAAKRFIVQEAVAEAFTEAFVAGVEALVMGDPLNEDTDIGPLVDEGAAQEMKGIIEDAACKGAKLLTGGRRNGAFIEPTVLARVTGDMRVVAEEVFGPIAPILIVRGEDEAIALANDTPFGLGGSIWSRDLQRGERVARRIAAGFVFVNSITKSDPRMPFGGIKDSGLGRELSHWGLKEFANVKGLSIYRCSGSRMGDSE